MAGKKKLGMGLDTLLSSVQSPVTPKTGNVEWTRIKNTFEQARREDEAGNVFEAYHLYRLAGDMAGEKGDAASVETRRLASQALNNAAVILCEHGYPDQARELLEKAVSICPDNHTARENLDTLLQGGIQP